MSRKQAIIKARRGVETDVVLEPLSERDEALWQVEKAKGEEYYLAIQKELDRE